MDLYELIKNLYGTEELKGYTDEDINFLKSVFGEVPAVLEEYCRKAGRTEELSELQDKWILPEHYQKWDWLKEEEYCILMNENQGVFQIGIKREDMKLADPPVYINMDNEGWKLYCETLSEFLLAESAYQAAMVFENSPEEFYWLSESEVEQIETRLEKYPFRIKNQVKEYPMDISFYYNAPDNLFVVIDCGEGDIQALYGAVSEESYNKLFEVVKDIGEPM